MRKGKGVQISEAWYEVVKEELPWPEGEETSPLNDDNRDRAAPSPIQGGDDGDRGSERNDNQNSAKGHTKSNGIRNLAKS